MLSPRTIITGTTVDFNQHCQLEIGEYAQVDEEHNNSMALHTTGELPFTLLVMYRDGTSFTV
jgi:hypothetical protein